MTKENEGPFIEFGIGWAKIHFRRDVTDQDRANLEAAISNSADGWPAWFPATPADNERGEELYVGGYTWTLHGEDGPKHYKYYDGRWHRIEGVANEHPQLALVSSSP